MRLPSSILTSFQRGVIAEMGDSEIAVPPVIVPVLAGLGRPLGERRTATIASPFPAATFVQETTLFHGTTTLSGAVAPGQYRLAGLEGGLWRLDIHIWLQSNETNYANAPSLGIGISFNDSTSSTLFTVPVTQQVGTGIGATVANHGQISYQFSITSNFWLYAVHQGSQATKLTFGNHVVLATRLQ